MTPPSTKKREAQTVNATHRVAMVDGGLEGDVGGPEGVVAGDEHVQGKNAAFEGGTGRTFHECAPEADVLRGKDVNARGHLRLGMADLSLNSVFVGPPDYGFEETLAQILRLGPRDYRIEHASPIWTSVHFFSSCSTRLMAPEPRLPLLHWSTSAMETTLAHSGFPDLPLVTSGCHPTKFEIKLAFSPIQPCLGLGQVLLLRVLHPRHVAALGNVALLSLAPQIER